MNEQSDEPARSLFKKVDAADGNEADHLSDLLETIAAKYETTRFPI